MIRKIKAALKAAGVPEKYAPKVQALFNIETEENLETYVTLFKDNILPDLTVNEADSDKAKKAAEAAAIATYEKMHGLKDGKVVGKKTPKAKKKDESDEEDDEDEDLEGLTPAMQKMIKAQQKQIQMLTDSVTNLTTNITTSGKTANAKAVFEGAKLPAKWFSRIDVNSEISIEDQIKDLQEELAEITQGRVNEEVEAGN
ncbi:MAG: hypothetical protein ACRCZZ_10010, partial [Phocaeicola sp.]